MENADEIEFIKLLDQYCKDYQIIKLDETLMQRIETLKIKAKEVEELND